MLKFSGAVIWRLGSRGTVRKLSTPSATVFKTDKLEANRLNSDRTSTEDDRESSGKNSGLLAAAFASINSTDLTSEIQIKPSPKSVKLNKIQQLDIQISKAQNIESLLVVAENPIVSRRHALKIVSILSEWSSSNKVQLGDFEKDPRFLKLCRILARTQTSQMQLSINMADDLSTVLGITGDDEAARLITNLTLPQMIKVMKALNQKGRRSTPLLRALSYNIVKQPDPIDLKKSADLLFSMVSLNFPDPMLMDRICSDVTNQLPLNEDKPAVVNSIVVSLGLLKYRDTQCLGALADWIVKHKNSCRASDIASAVVTLATVDCLPASSEQLTEYAATIKEEELIKPSSWLDLVFSLLILEKATEEHLSSTLRAEFIEKLLSSGEIPIPVRRKLMTIDAYVSLAFNKYSGARLPEDISVGVPIVYTKEKSLYVQSVMDTFRNLISSDNFMKKECNSDMGFLYDAEFALDANCNPVPLEKAANNKSVFRIAVLSLDYHDVCRRTSVPLGIYQLYTRMLELKGYNVLQIPYTEYNPRDKLVTRVQYIEKKLKEIVGGERSPS